MSIALKFCGLGRAPRNWSICTSRSFIEREGEFSTPVLPALTGVRVISWDKLVPGSRAEQPEPWAAIYPRLC